MTESVFVDARLSNIPGSQLLKNWHRHVTWTIYWNDLPLPEARPKNPRHMENPTCKLFETECDTHTHTHAKLVLDTYIISIARTFVWVVSSASSTGNNGSTTAHLYHNQLHHHQFNHSGPGGKRGSRTSECFYIYIYLCHIWFTVFLISETYLME